MKKISAIIIDDEILAVKRLTRLLINHQDLIEVIGEAYDGGSGLELVDRLKPDIVFLDVEMPVLNGFEMLAKLKHKAKIIFTTAFENYAIKAFEENSVDYLLKPIEAERLSKSIYKLKNLDSIITGPIQPEQIINLLKILDARKEVKSVPVKIGNKIILVKYENIIFFEAKEKFVYITTDDNKEYLTDFTITSLEEKLGPVFIRLHRAFIINSNKIKELYRGFNSSYIIVMADAKNTRISTGRTYIDRVKNLFDF